MVAFAQDVAHDAIMGLVLHQRIYFVLARLCVPPHGVTGCRAKDEVAPQGALYKHTLPICGVGRREQSGRAFVAFIFVE